MCVRWCNSSSAPFSCKNGVKQGGVLSPILFAIYMDELLDRLAKSGVGCFIGDEFVGGVCYADDLTLLAPTFSASKLLLNVCESFAEEYDVIFNAAKSQALVFYPASFSLPTCHRAKLSLNSSPIDFVDHAVHLGTYIGERDFELNIQRAQNELYARINSLHSRFHFCTFDVLRTLLISYCTSFYGSCLWNLTEVEPIEVAWRKSIRRLFNLSNRTHSRFIPSIIGYPTISVVLLHRFARFFTRCFFSQNSIVSTCARLSLASTSMINVNINYLCYSLNMDHPTLVDFLVSPSVKNLMSYLNIDVSVEDSSTCQTIIELIKILKGELTSPLAVDEAAQLLAFLCTY